MNTDTKIPHKTTNHISGIWKVIFNDRVVLSSLFKLWLTIEKLNNVFFHINFRRNIITLDVGKLTKSIFNILLANKE